METASLRPLRFSYKTALPYRMDWLCEKHTEDQHTQALRTLDLVLTLSHQTIQCCQEATSEAQELLHSFHMRMGLHFIPSNKATDIQLTALFELTASLVALRTGVRAASYHPFRLG